MEQFILEISSKSVKAGLIVPLAIIGFGLLIDYIAKKRREKKKRERAFDESDIYD
jgi:hypothetical protein